MHSVQCLIVDDEPVARRIIEGYLQKFEDYALVASCENALMARSILQSQPIDLIFLDLEMPQLHGFSFLGMMDQRLPQVIITTAHRNYALQGYEFEVLDYLLKPISFERFSKAIARFDRHSRVISEDSVAKGQDEIYLYIKVDRKVVKLLQGQILYIEGMSNYVRIYTTTEKYLVYMSLQDILKDLNADFIRVHKSYIVNRSKVHAFSREIIEVEGVQIPVGSTYKDVIHRI